MLKRQTAQELVVAKRAEALARADWARRKVGEVEGAFIAPAFSKNLLSIKKATGEVDYKRTREVAEALQREFNPKLNDALNAVNQINAVWRFFVLNGDISPFTIQLLVWGARHPAQAGGAMKGFIKAMIDPEFISKFLSGQAQSGFTARHPQLILPYRGPTEFTEAIRGGLLAKPQLEIAGKDVINPLYYLGKPLKPFAQGYEAAMTVAGVKFARSLEHMARTSDDLLEIDDVVNAVRGLASSDRLAVSPNQRGLEAAFLIAPQYMRATAAWFAMLGQGGIKGSVARHTMIEGMAALYALNVGISFALGEDEEDIVNHLLPWKQEFFTWTAGGVNLGPGSKVRALIKAVAQSAHDPETLRTIDWRENPGLRFIRYNLAYLPTKTVDLLTGSDAIMNPTRDTMAQASETILAEGLMPLWLKSVILEGGTMVERSYRAVGEFAGLRTYPETPSQKIHKYIEEREKKDWDDIQPVVKDRYYMQPVVREFIRENTDKGYQERMKEKWRYYDEQLGRDKEFSEGRMPGQAWREEYYDARGKRAVVLERIDTDFKRMRQSPRNDEEEALSQYFALMEKFVVPQTGMFLYEEWDKAEKRFLDLLDTQTRQYVVANKSMGQTPLVREYENDRVAIEKYQALQDEVAKRYPRGAQIEDALRTANELEKKILKADPDYKLYTRQLGGYKEFVRKLDPEMDAILLFWGYVSSPTTPQAAYLADLRRWKARGTH